MNSVKRAMMTATRKIAAAQKATDKAYEAIVKARQLLAINEVREFADSQEGRASYRVGLAQETVVRLQIQLDGAHETLISFLAAPKGSDRADVQ